MGPSPDISLLIADERENFDPPPRLRHGPSEPLAAGAMTLSVPWWDGLALRSSF